MYWLEDEFEYKPEAGYLLPCFVIGWAGVRPQAVGELIYAIPHQHGGFACSQVEVVGLVLPLLLNRERARADPHALLYELCVFSEVDYPGPNLDPWYSPFLGRWIDTCGHDMRDEDLKTFDRALAETYDGLPRARFGRESYVRFDPPSPERFRGWTALEIVEHEPQGVVLVEGSFAALDSLAAELGRPPALHLLWANSD